MKQVTTNLYSFAELSEKAQEKALDEWRNSVEYFWGNDALASLEAFAEAVGIKIVNYGIDWLFPSQSYVRWEGTPCTRYIKEDLTGYCADFSLTRTFNKTKDVDLAIDSWLAECAKDYDYQLSAECFAEHAEANEYLFTEDGCYSNL